MTRSKCTYYHKAKLAKIGDTGSFLLCGLNLTPAGGKATKLEGNNTKKSNDVAGPVHLLLIALKSRCKKITISVHDYLDRGAVEN